ncbi:MAG: 50S ribosomal protein L25 [Parachlamydiales bacterium]|nr:50S ribosomal protein L25 [Parachlamydiales bacterium]
MKLELAKRTSGKKGENNRLRREGNIPAILYNSKGEGHPVTVKGEELKAILRGMKSGLLSTTVFELHIDGKRVKALVKEVQYHVASYDIEHIDFLQLTDNEEVTVNVPIQMTGVADCAGVKLGGFLRQVIRSMKVSCLPKHIPQEFSIDVREMGIAQSKTLADIALPSHIKPLSRMNEVAVVVGKKAGT